ncbi:hypothetical protein [Cerasicoccus fimbriatus]|uniref:hypothetical protein n=1 Tax=Cerasicoccus fimbriatus TaxID=3014554 RepID=UPI0022B5C5A9|nr:hypothetical protein [Cerasicoccus sp. TK19100]
MSDPKYMNEGFVKKLQQYIEKPKGAPKLTLDDLKVNGDTAVSNYTAPLKKIHKALIETETEGVFTIKEEARKEIRSIAENHQNKEPIKYLAKEMWKVDIAALPVEQGVQTLPDDDEDNPPAVPAEIELVISTGSEILPGMPALSKNTSMEQITGMIQSIAQGLALYSQSSRQYLEVSLYLGAALIHAKIQFSLMDKVSVRSAKKQFTNDLGQVLGKGASALKSLEQRLTLQYCQCMAQYKSLKVPSIKDRVALRKFYERTVGLIPACIDHALTLRDSRPPKSQATVDFTSLLKLESDKAMMRFNKKSEADKQLFIDSAISRISAFSSFFDAVPETMLSKHRQTLDEEITKLQSIRKKLGQS